jgi:hypothetical protein
MMIPGLLGAWSQDISYPPTPALDRLLSRATMQPVAAMSFETALFDLFGVGATDDKDLPVAAVTGLSDGIESRADWWLRADPVHLHADLHRVLLYDARGLDIELQEAQALAAECNHRLGGDDWVLQTPTARRWYLRLNDDPAIATHSLYEAVGHDINSLLPRGEAAQRWQALLTEIQMLFYESEVNRERERNGRPLINSVWFWGAGVAPQALRKPPAADIFADDPLTRGLTLCAQNAVADLPAGADDWHRLCAYDGTSLVVTDTLRDGLVDRDFHHWSAQLQQLEQDWFEPCVKLFNDKQLDQLILDPVDGRIYSISRSDLRRFWQRTKPLTHFIN